MRRLGAYSHGPGLKELGQAACRMAAVVGGCGCGFGGSARVHAGVSSSTKLLPSFQEK